MNTKIIAGLALSIIGVGLAGSALAGNYVEIGDTGLASTTAYIGDLFSDVSVFVWLAIGVPLAFYVINKVVGIVRGRSR